MGYTVELPWVDVLHLPGLLTRMSVLIPQEDTPPPPLSYRIVHG